MTKGEQMLIDLGYTIRKYEKPKETIFDSNWNRLTFSNDTKTLYMGYDGCNELDVDAKEIQAIHQIMIDYGWDKDANETIGYADQSGLTSAEV